MTAVYWFCEIHIWSNGIKAFVFYFISKHIFFSIVSLKSDISSVKSNATQKTDLKMRKKKHIFRMSERFCMCVNRCIYVFMYRHGLYSYRGHNINHMFVHKGCEYSRVFDLYQSFPFIDVDRRKVIFKRYLLWIP